MRNATSHKLKIGRIVCICLVLSLIFTCPTIYAADFNHEDREVIKVGCPYMEQYFMQSESDIKSGYGYEILQKMLIYENWTYDYIDYAENYSQADMISKLEAGQIDMLTYAFKNEKYAEKFSYSDIPIGHASDLIVVKSGNNTYSVNNYDNWNGIKAGFIKNDDFKEEFENYADNNNFTFETYLFDSLDDLSDAIQSGKIDIAVTDNHIRMDDVWVLGEFNNNPLYIMVNKSNSKLINQVNDALHKILLENDEYFNNLYQKYYISDLGNVIAYTVDERAFLDNCAKSGTVFKAIINPDRKPLSYYEDGEVKGLLKDICQKIFDYSGLSVEFIVTTNRDDYVAQMENADIICDFTGNVGKAESSGCIMSGAYYNSTTSMLRRKDYDGTGKRCAIVGSGISSWLKDNFDGEFLSYDSVDQCTQAVIDGEADFVYSYTRCVQEWVYSDITNSLVVVADNHQNTDFSIVVKNTENANLSSILTKSIGTITTEDISSISDEYTYYQKGNQSLLAMIYAQPVIFVVVFFVFALFLFGSVLFVFIVHQRKKDKEKNKKLSEALEEAKEANRAKTEFFSRVSHDMRTPMNGILGLADLSLDENNEKVVKNNINQIQESGKYLLGLINDTLNYQKIESGNLVLRPQPVRIQSLITSVADMIKKIADNKGITFKVTDNKLNLDEYIMVDALYMKQILVNLLSNAVKFTPSGGTVELIVETTGSKENVISMRFVVMDTGIGMSSEFLENGIYNPFSQEHNNYTSQGDGTGLGLSIVKQLVNLMGASIYVESKPEIGTKFTVDVDFTTVNSDEVVKTEEIGKAEKGKLMQKLNNKKILLVEDHPLNAQITRSLLEKAQCKITWAKDGQKAVNTFCESEIGYYDVILMDIRMPIMNGWEASKEIRSLNREDAKSVPIIALTANAYEDDVKNSFDAGMNAHLAKPIDPVKMYETILEVTSKGESKAN